MQNCENDILTGHLGLADEWYHLIAFKLSRNQFI